MRCDPVPGHKYYMLMGWARALQTEHEIHKEQEHIITMRKEGRWAILVADDIFALAYQRLNFRRQRMQYAIRGPLVGGWGSNVGRYTEEYIKESNRKSMEGPRALAHRAKKRLTKEDIDTIYPPEDVNDYYPSW